MIGSRWDDQSQHQAFTKNLSTRTGATHSLDGANCTTKYQRTNTMLESLLRLIEELIDVLNFSNTINK